MDSDFLNYRQSLSNYSGFGGQISALKDKIYSEKTAGLEAQKLDISNAAALRESADQETDSLLGAGGGALGTISSALGMKKLGSKIVNSLKSKVGKEGEDLASNLKGKASDAFESLKSKVGSMKGQAESKMNELRGNAQQKVDELRGNNDSMDTGSSGVENPETGAMERPLAQSETTIPDTELGAGTEPTSEPSGYGGEFDPDATANIELSNQANQGLEDFPEAPDEGVTTAAEGGETADLSSAPADVPTQATAGIGDAAADAAAEGGEVAAEVGTDAAVAGLETAGAAFDTIPIIGDIIGGVLGIAGAVVGAVGAADAAKDTEETNDLTQQESTIKSSISNMGGFGSSAIVGSVMSSTAGMPSNSGTF